VLIRSVRRLLVAVLFAVVAFGGWVGGISPAATRIDTVANAAHDPMAAAPSTISSPAPSLAAAPPTTDGQLAAPGASPYTAPDAGAPLTPTTPGNPSGLPSATAAIRAALDVRLERWRVKTGTPGVSVAIFFPDGSAWHGAAGLADVKAGRKVTADTAFPIASISKTFTSALVLDLVADGRLSFDGRARTYLPTLPIDPAITIRQLLDHTSGLRDFYINNKIDAALQGDRSRVWSPQMALRYIGKPYGRPGTLWHYSNTNYLVLGMIAEAVGKAPVAEQLRARFFGPLGLDETWYQAVERPRAALAKAYRFKGTKVTAAPVSLSDGSGISPFTSVVTASGGAGSIASTAGDLARWVSALYGGNALEPVTRTALIGSVVETQPYRPPIGYGLGVQALTIDGHPSLGHSGRFLGARAAARWLPTERLSIAVVTNQSRSDPNALVADLLKVVFPPKPAPTPAATHASLSTSTHP
jgi:D-alanyl-D-alanine carboxypeptidase